MAGIAAGRRLDHRDSAHRDAVSIDSGGMSPRWRVMPPVHISEAPLEGNDKSARMVQNYINFTSFPHLGGHAHGRKTSKFVDFEAQRLMDSSPDCKRRVRQPE